MFRTERAISKFTAASGCSNEGFTMINENTWVRRLAPLVMILAAGCAPNYHSYSGCNVGCKYCVPPPLPYAHYEGCVCHSCAASSYLSAEPIPTDEDADSIGDE